MVGVVAMQKRACFSAMRMGVCISAVCVVYTRRRLSNELHSYLQAPENAPEQARRMWKGDDDDGWERDVRM